MNKTGWVFGIPPVRWFPFPRDSQYKGTYRRAVPDASGAERHEVFHLVTIPRNGGEFPEEEQLESADCGVILQFVPWHQGDALPRYYEFCRECVAINSRTHPRSEPGWKQAFVHERHVAEKAPI